MKKLYISILPSIFFLLLYFFLFVPSASAQLKQCGSDLYNGRHTGCYAVNLGGETIPPEDASEWASCGLFRQCFIFEYAGSRCGYDTIIASDGKERLTFCAQSMPLEKAAYGGCNFTESCYVGTYVGDRPAEWVQGQENREAGFCADGFQTKDELRSARIEFQCVGGWTSCKSAPQVISLAGTSDEAIGDSPNGKFTCLFADFDGAFKQAVKDYLTYQAPIACHALGAAELGLFLIPGAKLATSAFTTAKAAVNSGRIALGLMEVPVVGMQQAAKSQVFGLAMTAAKQGVKTAVVTTAPLTASFSICSESIHKWSSAIQARVILADGTVASVRELQLGASPENELEAYFAPKNAGLGVTDICNFIPSSEAKGNCFSCFFPEDESTPPGVYTPFGCIQSNPQKLVENILRLAIGIAGGIAFLMIVYGGFMTMTSAGNPEKLTGGKEIITSAIAGLLLIIFSVIILRIIGVDILGIPGLTG